MARHRGFGHHWYFGRAASIFAPPPRPFKPSPLFNLAL
jgi:hypothetical protein